MNCKCNIPCYDVSSPNLQSGTHSIAIKALEETLMEGERPSLDSKFEATSASFYISRIGLNLQNINIIGMFMSYLWKHPDKWKSWCDKENCPVCLNAPVPPEYVTIRETDVAWLEATPNVPLWGTCYVMSKKHVVEIFELSDEEAFAFLKDVMSAAKALKEVTSAIKINYEIHGNTVPHLHIHLFPRYQEDDRFEDGIINPRNIEPSVYKEGEFELFVKKMRDTLC